MSDLNIAEKRDCQDKQIGHDSGSRLVGRSFLELLLHFVLSLIK